MPQWQGRRQDWRGPSHPATAPCGCRVSAQRQWAAEPVRHRCRSNPLCRAGCGTVQGCLTWRSRVAMAAVAAHQRHRAGLRLSCVPADHSGPNPLGRAAPVPAPPVPAPTLLAPTLLAPVLLAATTATIRSSSGNRYPPPQPHRAATFQRGAARCQTALPCALALVGRVRGFSSWPILSPRPSRPIHAGALRGHEAMNSETGRNVPAEIMWRRILADCLSRIRLWLRSLPLHLLVDAPGVARGKFLKRVEVGPLRLIDIIGPG